jgi:putative Mn2+ efflux pump MntP
MTISIHASYLLLFIGMFMVYYGLYHYSENTKKSQISNHKDFNNLIIDAEWEEIDSKQNKIDTYA